MGKIQAIKPEERQELSAWLLKSSTPSIRYLTLTKILGKPETDEEVITARRLIATSDPVKAILEKQAPEGYWQMQKHYYSPKYRASHWSMLLLSELVIDPQHPAMQKGAAFMRKCFEEDPRLNQFNKTKDTYWGCLWGNALRYQLYSQNQSEELTQVIMDYVVRDLLNLSRCRYNNDLPCAWGVARDLFGLALIPESQRGFQTKAAIEMGLKFMLEDYDLLKADYPHVEKIHDLWGKISFPLFYHADILFVLRVAKELNALDYPQAIRGQEWLLSKRSQNGKWSGGSPFRQRTWPFIAKGDNIQHWLTLQALSIFS